MVQAENAAHQDSRFGADAPAPTARRDGGPGSYTPDTFPRLLAFLLLISFAGVLECLRLSALRDADFWWHLRVGDWILANRSWPTSGLFSQASGNIWRDFQWGFDVIAALTFRALGFRALPALLIALRAAFAVVSFLLAGGWRGFWGACGLSVIGQFLVLPLGPGPAFVSLIFFGVELLLLLEIRDSGNFRWLLALPVLFFFWANVDANFIYGVALLLLFVGATWMEHRKAAGNPLGIERAPAKVSLRMALATFAGCFFAIFLNPYGWHPLFSFLPGRFSLVNDYLPGFKALGFRQPQDYLLMLVAMGAFFALGLRRSRDLFQIAALVAVSALAFYSRQESGFLVLVSVAVIGRSLMAADRGAPSHALSDWSPKRLGSLFGAAVLLLVVFWARVPRDRQPLLAKIGESFPVRAADFLSRQRQPEPLFNSYAWGGFLMWYLPEYPVAIDARPGLYSDDERRAYFRAMNADIPYRDCPSMNQARTLLLEKGNVLAEAFRGVVGFQLIYEDDISLVYGRAGDK